ncbi:hypothetical protein TWF481_001530 [Arthrobotrys musiformis]|uniref:UvrD-like helicase ATP-binding domain-containing protein n=1 Tax=Arthrobotrys musiformis TaxID=47236 RepID=A0AAV9WRV4_9PEZI
MNFVPQEDVTEDSDFSRIMDEAEINTIGLIDLETKDWPLVCTYDSFATMLERSLRFAQRNVFSADTDLEASRLQIDNRRVDFGKFKRSYWPAFPTAAKKNLSADGVFSEIIGIIKANSSASEYRHLSEAEYQSLSHRVAPSFRQGPEREAVYALYKIYEKRKASFGEWDDLDRTSKLRKLLAKDKRLSSLLRSRITEVFVDEIQDQRLAEIELLLDLVNDIRSFAFAGDTAQCISRDSCFRFQDLQSAFYRKYERIGTLANEKDLAKLSRFTLSKNYRTHNGKTEANLYKVLKLAAKIVDALSTAFPYAIDKFSPELGEFDGPAPIVFSGFTSDIFIPRQGGNTATISEFGAEQVLIVRDEAAKDVLLERMGDTVLILTILESKGMEFQDVFLFDFFSGSSCLTAFRALANSYKTNERLDETKYPELCIELKNLYVAVTRSREMLYVIESEVIAVHPLETMWGLGSGDPIVDIVTPDDPTLQTRLDEIKQGQSQPHEWKEKGDEFFNQRMYEQATYCYKRAGNTILADLCKASIEERNGRDIISDPNCWVAAKKYYLEAARLFRGCQKEDKALNCYESIQEYQMAGDLCEELSKIPAKEKDNYTLRAANYFMSAGAVLKAIELFKKLGLHDRVIDGYRKLDNRKDLIHYLIKYKKNIDSKLFNRTSRIIALSIFSSKNAGDDLKKPAIGLLSEQEQEQLYRQFKFLDELSQLLVSQGRLADAIQLNFFEGKWKEVKSILDKIPPAASQDSEFLTTHGSQCAERVLFFELSTSLVDFLQKGNKETSSKGFVVRNLAYYPQVSKLFQDTSKFLNQIIFGKNNPGARAPSSSAPEARALANLMALKYLALSYGASSTQLPDGRLPMGNIITLCAQKLLDLHKSRTLANDDTMLLIFEAVARENGDGYNITKPSPVYDGDGFGTQHVTGDHLVSRIVQVLQRWIVEVYDRHRIYQKQEYYRLEVCRYYALQG